MTAFSTFEARCHWWCADTMGIEVANDLTERNHRFLEEALEFVQSNGCTREDAHALVEYVFNRPQGDISQELGGVMVTLAVLCSTLRLSMEVAGENELKRCWENQAKIKAKHDTKPHGSPLPGVTLPT